MNGALYVVHKDVASMKSALTHVESAVQIAKHAVKPALKFATFSCLFAFTCGVVLMA